MQKAPELAFERLGPFKELFSSMASQIDPLARKTSSDGVTEYPKVSSQF